MKRFAVIARSSAAPQEKPAEGGFTSRKNAGFTPHVKKLCAGFTLIEMLIVVAIIGLLSSVILVGLGDVRKEARDTRRISDVRQIQNQVEIYYSEHQSYPPDVYELPGAPFDPVANPETGEFYEYAYERLSQNSYLLGACLEGERPTGISHISQDFQNGISNYGAGCNCSDASNMVYCVKS